MALIAWPTANANSYVTQAAAVTYFADMLGPVADAFTAATSANRDKALVTATRRIDMLAFAGEKTVEAQTLEFPRDGAVTLPDAIVEATYELAGAYLHKPSLIAAEDTGSNIKRAKAGSAEVEYFTPMAGNRFPIAAWRLLAPFLPGYDEAGLFSVFSGTDFEAEDTDYGLTGGYY